MRMLALVITLAGGPALAQGYPFEGRWEQGGNGCNQADTFTARGMSYYAAGGGCRFTSLNRVSASTYRYRASCKDGTGQYTTSGTIEMAGPNRMMLRDRLMQGQATTYTRC